MLRRKTTLMDVLAGRKTGIFRTHAAFPVSCSSCDLGRLAMASVPARACPRWREQVRCAAGGRISGEIMVDGHPKVQETFARVSGYVEQVRLLQHTPHLVSPSTSHRCQHTCIESVALSAHSRVQTGQRRAGGHPLAGNHGS